MFQHVLAPNQQHRGDLHSQRRRTNKRTSSSNLEEEQDSKHMSKHIGLQIPNKLRGDFASPTKPIPLVNIVPTKNLSPPPERDPSLEVAAVTSNVGRPAPIECSRSPEMPQDSSNTECGQGRLHLLFSAHYECTQERPSEAHQSIQGGPILFAPVLAHTSHPQKQAQVAQYAHLRPNLLRTRQSRSSGTNDLAEMEVIKKITQTHPSLMNSNHNATRRWHTSVIAHNAKCTSFRVDNSSTSPLHNMISHTDKTKKNLNRDSGRVARHS